MKKIEKIKELTDKKIWIAPLAGITDNSYRTILKDCDADILVSEMVSADGLIYNKERSLSYARFDDYQRPFGIQLFGSDPQIIAKATELIITEKPDFIDINMGCPVKKVVNRKAGSYLMKDEKTACDIVCSVKNKLQNTEILLSVKIRSGWDFQSINAISFAKKIEEAGADILIIHPRTRSQMFSGKSDWGIIKKIKENLTIPIIGNGDITAVQDAFEIYEQTNCDSIMIGRGIIGKPWLITQIKHFLLTSKYLEINYLKRLEIIKKHFSLSIKYRGEDIAIKEMRTHFSHYTKGIRGGAKVRDRINKSGSKEEIINLISEFFYEQN
ncbi:MAG: tRNA dihydrouridine synthase DusB [Candidatus Cloacimonetes bacterium]|nr:tRNA dihydrouridine synthase DusB [Candidatus Cloacimonadota bacterium]